jgi:TetR/AcrR family tetracycline transcriptional repressor
MALTKQDIARAGLRLLNQVGLHGLTLRLIAEELGVKAPALYWHMKNKQELLDEMATQMYRDAERPKDHEDWAEMLTARAWAARRMVLSYRDGAKVYSGTYFTDPTFPADEPRRRLVEVGFTPEQAFRALFTLANFVSGFSTEEQAIYPMPGERDPRYPSTFDDMDDHFADGLKIVLTGIRAWANLP